MPKAIWESKPGELLTAALDLAGRGWHVFPLHHVEEQRCSCGDLQCKSQGKHPRTPNGLKDGTSDGETVRSWWARWPSANVGVCTGPESGVWMLGPDGEEGIKALAELVRKYAGLPRTPRARSGSGGRHYYFRWPADGNIVNRRNHRGLPIDVRGEGGYFVAPPSHNRNGPYVWELHPKDCELADAPQWLLAWCRSKGLKAKATAAPSITDRAIKYLEKMPPAISGQGGHDTTMDAARAVVYGFDLGPEVGFRLLWDHYNQRCQPEWTEKELRHKCEEANSKPFGKPRGWLLNGHALSAGGKSPPRNGPAPPAKTPPMVVRTVDDYQPFPIDALPPCVRSYVRQGAAALGCDPAFVALPVLSVLASAIGNTRVIRLKRGWTEPTILWTVIVGDSGTLKSPAYFLAVNRLFVKQEEFMAEFLRAAASYQDELRKWKDKKKKFDKGEAADPGEEPEQPVLRRVIVCDTTIEKLAEILEDNRRGTLVARDELAGWIGSFTKYKGKQGGSDVPNWLELNRAGTIIIDRKTGERRTLFIKRASVSVAGGIQPGVLARALTAELLESGLAARLLPCWPPRVPKRWSEAEIDPDTERVYHDLLDQLLDLDFIKDREGKAAPRVLHLSEEAKTLWVSFYDRWAREQAAVEGELAAAYSKLEGYAARFALLYHVVGYAASKSEDAEPIGSEAIEAGITLARWFAGEARRIYSTLSESTEEREARRLVEFIRAHGGEITAKQLQHSNSRKYPTAASASAALDSLVSAGIAEWIDRPSGPKGGRPSRILCLKQAHDETDQTDETDTEAIESPDETFDETSGTPSETQSF
jgi:hypothetical protein